MGFENSKLTKICYHGTNSDSFTVLDKSKIQKNPEDGDPGYFGWGFYLTTNKDYAESFGDNVLEFKVNIQNPFDFSDVNGEEIVDFIFEDCKNLKLRVNQTLRVINQIGRGLSWDFDTDNSEELLYECRKLYNTYRGKEVDSEFIDDEKKVLVKLSKDVGNWLNGIFYYFGRELFHYFTKNGYDGVIALGGEEVVVYETEQLEPVIHEDLDFDEVEIDWESGSDEYTKRIIDSLERHPEVTDIKLYIDKFYPKRLESIWYAGGLLTFRYKDLLDIYFYCGGDLIVFRDEDDDDPMRYIEDLEDEGIFTDDDYYDFLKRTDAYNNGLVDDNSKYFGFAVTPLKNNEHGAEFYAYDMGYDDYYNLHEIFDSKSDDPVDWIFSSLIPEFINEHPEYFTEEDKHEENTLQEKTNEVKKHITKGKVLSDVISTFGTISVDKLTDAVYLLPNGNILDTKGSNEKSQHENVADYISKKYNINDKDEDGGSKLMLELGAMRITPWIPAMFIPKHITKKQ